MTHDEYVKAQMALAEFKANEDVIKDLHAVAAKCMRSYYVELINAGFSPQEALFLVGEHGWMPKMPGQGGQG